jgi:uncharacterized OB-fold protein
MMTAPVYLDVPGAWNLKFRYAAGKAAGRFLYELKENGRIWATKCPECKFVIFPPRAFCDRCFVAADEWVDLGLEGELISYTIVTEEFEGQPPPPYIMCYVRFGEASSTIFHFLSDVDLSDVEEAGRKLRPGLKVRAVMKDISQREGSPQDFKVVLAEPL